MKGVDMPEDNLVVLNIKRPDEALFKSSETMLELAKNRTVTTPGGAITVGEDLKTVKRLAKEVNEKRLAITRPLNDALKEVNALFKPAQDWLKQSESLLKGKILEFQNEQERIARELQAKADAEARKEREKLERKARLAEVVRRPEKAEELREEAETQVAPVVTSAAPKISGVVRRETWKAEVTDKQALVKHIVDNQPALLVMVKIDQSLLNARAREMKDKFDLPGARAVKEASIAAGRS